MAYSKVCVFCKTGSDILKLITPYIDGREEDGSRFWGSYTVAQFINIQECPREIDFDYFIRDDGNIVAKNDLSLVALGFDETALSCVFRWRLNQYMDQAQSQGLCMATLSCHT